MHLVLVGLNHKTAPVDVRENLAFTDKEIGARLPVLLSCGVEEGAILSTCNRTEVYAVAADTRTGVQGVCSFLHGRARERLAAANGDARVPKLDEHIYVYRDLDVARHAFRVAAGLDSLVVGEEQILGQVREAFARARNANGSGPFLSKLFQSTIRAGRSVRSQTALDQGAASISYAAVELARNLLGTLKGKRILLVGAGKMSELAAENLAGQEVASVVVANRSHDRAEALAGAVGGRAVSLEDLPEWLGRVDLVISSTGAPQRVIGHREVAAALRHRDGGPLYLIDIAVPRDVDPEVRHLDGVQLYNVDDLRAVVDARVARSLEEVGRAEQILDEEATRFDAWFKERRAVPVIAALRHQAENLRKHELEKTLRKLDHLPEDDKERVRALTVALINKMLHNPTIRLKEQVQAGNGEAYLKTTEDLFSLGSDSQDNHQPPAK